eukprot:TRINITY_DN3192_c0_g3_i1.p1 TRINITY_DN3192_c0_g3~~TRINITY_DN3192_c0_g3_i1.p1  ORF type:complete len:412 (+),score=70.69 TRINITY_DN3192_c0_g3_i1:54-1289(+)
MDAPSQHDPDSAEESGRAKRKRAKDSRACVSRACVRCKAAKKCCDEQRPCQRCVRMGLGDQCYDATHMKPGRKPKPLSEIIGYDPSAQPAALLPMTNPPSSTDLTSFYEQHTDAFALFDMATAESPAVQIASFYESSTDPLLHINIQTIIQPLHTSVMDQWMGSLLYFVNRLKDVGLALSMGITPMPVELYQVLSQYVLIQAERFGVPKETVQSLRDELWGIDKSVEGAIRRYLDLRQQRRPRLIASKSRFAGLGQLPMGVIAICHAGLAPDIFVNSEAAQLFGYRNGAEELMQQLQSDMDAVFVRHLHPGDWQRAMPAVMACIAKREEKLVTKTRAYTVSGQLLELTMTIAFQYDPQGVPVATIMYMVRVELDATVQNGGLLADVSEADVASALSAVGSAHNAETATTAS